MITNAINRLEYLCDLIPKLLLELDEGLLSEKVELDKWSKKEILGHLIDSATNNHHRFVRAQYENNPVISYDQDQWCKYNFYQNIHSYQIISLWKFYNLQLIEFFKNIPEENLSRKSNDLTLEFLINDYVVHLEHHLKQIVDY